MSIKLSKCMETIGQLSSITRYSQSILSKPENVLEHTGFVALLCMFIADEIDSQQTLMNQDTRTQIPIVDRGLLLQKALVHDIDEVMTGDIARPTKYHNERIKEELDNFAADSANNISGECGVKFYHYWNEAKSGPEGEIVSLCDALSVLHKAHDEVVMRGNKTMNFGSVDGLIKLIGDRFYIIEESYGVSLEKCYRECVQMADELKEVLK